MQNSIKKIILIVLISLMPVFLSAQWLETNIVVGREPFSLCYLSNNNKIYVANEDSTITVIDGATNSVIATIFAGPTFNPPQPVYPSSRFFAYNSENNKIYFASDSNTVMVLDGTADSILTTIEVGEIPYALLYNPANNKVYCANRSSNNVTVIDGANDVVLDTVPVGDSPVELAYNFVDNKVYSADHGGSVTVIDAQTDTVVATIPIGDYAVGLVYNSTNNKIYCTTTEDNRITAIDGVTDSTVKIIDLQYHPALLAYNSTDNKVYCSTEGDTLLILDSYTDSIIRKITKVGGIWDVELLYNSTDNKIYCGNREYQDTVLVIDGESDSIIAKISTEARGPGTFARNPLHNRIYVANRGDSVVSVIRTAAGIEEDFTLNTITFEVYPNLFCDKTTVRYELGKAVNVDISVYNMLGQKVGDLYSGEKSSGVHEVSWEGTGNTGEKLSSGIYFLRIEAGGQEASRKLIFVR